MPQASGACPVFISIEYEPMCRLLDGWMRCSRLTTFQRKIKGFSQNRPCYTGITNSAKNSATCMSTPFIPPRHKLTVDDYHRMTNAGIFDEDSHVELIEGELIDMAPTS